MDFVPGGTEAMSRRAFVKRALAVGGSSALAACVDRDGEPDAPDGVDDPDTLPGRQHAWNDALRTDEHGNDVPPRHHVLLALDCQRDGTPTEDDRAAVERALASVERAVERSPDGLLSTVGYSPSYFERFDAPPTGVDLPKPRALTSLEDPDRHREDALVHLASDEGSLLLAAEEALFGDRETLNGRSVEPLDGVFEVTERRTGFVGERLPAENQDVAGIPDTEPVPDEAPFFSGFRSGFARTQASEDRVTIEDGPFAGGTTMHFERMELQLDQWFEQDSHRQRVAKLFSPRHASEGLVGETGENLTNDTLLTDDDLDVAAVARNEGVVGHAQKVARARENGEPRLLRRDVNSTDGERAGLHFLSLQETIEDFVITREAMAGENLAAGTVGARTNNGFLQYAFVRGRGNYLVPPRRLRALPPADPTGDD